MQNVVLTGNYTLEGRERRDDRRASRVIDVGAGSFWPRRRLRSSGYHRSAHHFLALWARDHREESYRSLSSVMASVRSALLENRDVQATTF